MNTIFEVLQFKSGTAQARVRGIASSIEDAELLRYHISQLGTTRGYGPILIVRMTPTVQPRLKLRSRFACCDKCAL